MWDYVVDLITEAVNSAFGWFTDILNAAPGAWDTIFTVFVILVLSRFLLGPLLGGLLNVGSDKVKKSKGDD